MLKIILMLTCCVYAQTYNVNKTTLHEMDILNTTYISPALNANNVGNHHEHSLLLKLNTLINEVTNGRHPQHRSDKILVIAKTYVEMNKVREDRITSMNREMEIYLGTRKTN